MFSLVLAKLDVVAPGAGILLHLKVLGGETKGLEDHVAELLEAVHHLGLEPLVPLLYLGRQPPHRPIGLHMLGVHQEDLLVVSQGLVCTVEGGIRVTSVITTV